MATIVAEIAAKFACSGPLKWFALPFLPLPSIIIPPFCLIWVGMMIAIHYSNTSVLNTKDGEKSWLRSFECALGIYYGFMLFFIAVAVLWQGCKLVKAMPVVP